MGSIWMELKLTLVILILFAIPGWSILGITRIWKFFEPFQRWCIAIGVGIVFYPILYYFARLVPNLHLGPNKLIAILVVLFLVMVIFLRKDWKQLFYFEILEVITAAVIIATLFTRLWMAHLYPYPAWTDSLHHTLLTLLTAQDGRLPYTLEPFEPASLDMYHLGLYAITATVQNLTNVPSYTALLWTAQILNGLCGLGVFLVVDRLAGRKGALAATVFVGLLSFQPAWYFNWGRFTQVSSQAVILIAWLVNLETIRTWRRNKETKSLIRWAFIAISAWLNAGVFLLHFRVGGFYILLLGISIVFEFYSAWKEKTTLKLMEVIGAIGSISLLLVLPVLIPALGVYLQRTFGPQIIQQTSTGAGYLKRNAYFDYTYQTVLDLGVKPWMVIVGTISAIIGLIYRNIHSIEMLLWMGVLWVIGNAYHVGLYWLSFSNFFGIYIMYYLPISLLFGYAVEECFRHFKILGAPSLQNFFLIILLLLGFISSHYRVAGVENYRQFVTSDDITAMEWIKANTPQNAVFAINTSFPSGIAPYGTDGGYWIPYFTGRKTTTGTMLASLGPTDFVRWITTSSEQVTQLDQNPQAANELCQLGVHYVYIGKKGDPFEEGLKADKIVQASGSTILYQKNGVTIIGLCQKQ
jgi:hypothetical protein